jgi:hypothetical protein
MRSLLILFLSAVAAAQTPPSLSLRVNGGAPAVRGWPMLVEVIALSPDPEIEWTEVVRLQVNDADGQAAFWPLERLLSPHRTLIYRLTPEQTAAITEGVYELGVLLAGNAAAVLELKMEAEWESPTREQLEQKTSVLANYRFLIGDMGGALIAVDQLRGQYPESIVGLLLKGDLAAELRSDEEAARAYADALSRLPADHPAPRALLRRYHELLEPLLHWQ